VRSNTASTSLGSSPHSSNRPAISQNPSWRDTSDGCGASTSRGRTWVASSTPPSRPRISLSRPSRRRSEGALVEPLRGGGTHLLLDVSQQRLRAVAHEQPQRLVQLAPVQVRIEVAQAWRQAAPHLAIRGRVIAPRQAAAAMTQAKQRVELLHQLPRQRPAADRPDRHRVP
jgi:hypothetical protein